MVGGVAGGLAEHLDLDPLIVRAGFVVLAVAGGSGILLYLLGWLLLPEEGERESIAAQTLGSRPWDWRRRRNVVIAALIILAFWGGIRPWHWSFGPSVIAILAIAGIALSGRRHSPPGSPGPGRTGSDPGHPGPGLGGDPTIADQFPEDAEGRDRVAPDSTMPHSNVPFSSLSTSKPQPTPWWTPSAPRQPSLVLPLLAGLAVLVAVSAGLTATGWVSVPLAAVVTVALLMSLAALIAGAQRGRFVGATLLCLVFAVALAFSAAVPHPLDGGVGERTWHPADVSELKPSYRLGSGAATLDLSDIDLKDVRKVKASVGTGDLTVTVPANTTVHVRERATIGSAEAFGGRQGGVSIDRTSVDPDGSPILDLDLQVGIGTIEVQRAAA
jgi:phage shock protein PspC (stress-responsive transcriptional regulator)